MEKTMGKKIVHMWRCINCGKMTDAYICTHCGKESYVKDWSETTIQDEKPKLTEKLISKSDKEKIYTTAPSPETPPPVTAAPSMARPANTPAILS